MRKTFSNLAAIVVVIFIVLSGLANLGGALDTWGKFVDSAQERFKLTDDRLPSDEISFVIVVVVGVLILLLAQHLLTKEDGPLTPKPNDPTKAYPIYRDWVKKDVNGRWRSTIHNVLFLDLGLEIRSDSVNPWTYTAELGDDERVFSTIDEAYEHYERQLLLLGNPGAGKTTTLLTIAQKLIAAAEADATQPLPVILNLSLWGSVPSEGGGLGFLGGRQRENPSIHDWIVEQLSGLGGAGVKADVAETWIDEHQLALLFDGFDEADPRLREELLDALNAFSDEFTPSVMVVCCRIDDYQPFIEREHLLRTNGGIRLRPLNRQQISDYLTHVQADALRDAIQADEALYELAETPLTLSMMTLAYKDADLTTLPDDANLLERRTHLFDQYVRRMMQRQARRAKNLPHTPADLDRNLVATPYSDAQVNRYLGWLAQRMSERNVTAFSPRGIYDFLRSWNFHNRFRYTTAVTDFILAFIVSFGVWWLITEQSDVITHSIKASIIAFIGGIGIVAIRWVDFASQQKFDVRGWVGALFISIGFATWLASILNLIWADGMIPLGIILIILAVLWDSIKKTDNLSLTCIIIVLSSLVYGLGALFVWVGGIGVGVAGGFSSTYDGRSIGFGVLFALPLLVGGLILNTPIAPLSIAVGIFPFGWFFLESLYDSKRPILKWVGKHTRTMSDQLAKWSSYTCDSLVLNVLVVSGALPWRFRRFLNFSDDALLLKRAGNDYEFVHRLLREHFALRDYLPLMHADDEATRLELVKSLAILGDDAAEPLRHISQHDPSEAVRQAASDAQFT